MKRADNPELEALMRAAKAEAAEFTIDPGRLEGWEHIQGYAVDNKGQAEDAIFAREENGQEILQVSFANPASFIAPDLAMASLALWNARGYYGSVGGRSMFPDRIHKLFSLRDGQPKPALTWHLPVDEEGNVGELRITRNIITVKAMTRAEAGLALKKEGGEGELSLLMRILQRLLNRRFAYPYPGIQEGYPRLETEDAIGQLLVREAMSAANVGAGLYMKRRIPGIYVNFMPEDHERTRFRRAFSTTPRGNAIFNGRVYAPVSSPLRQSRDFVNHANIVAYLDKRPPPYQGDLLSYAIQRTQGEDVPLRIIARSDLYLPSKKEELTAAVLLSELAQKRLYDSVVAQTIMGTFSGTEAEVRHVRQVAVERMAQNPNLARAVLEIILHKHWLRSESQPDESAAGQHVRVFVDIDGNTYPDMRNGIEVHDAVEAARLFAAIVGHEVEPRVPLATSEGKIVKNPFNYLRGACKTRNMAFICTPQPDNAEGEKVILAHLDIAGEHHSQKFTADSTVAAKQIAAEHFIRRFDLIA